MARTQLDRNVEKLSQARSNLHALARHVIWHKKDSRELNARIATILNDTGKLPAYMRGELKGYARAIHDMIFYHHCFFAYRLPDGTIKESRELTAEELRAAHSYESAFVWKDSTTPFTQWEKIGL